MIISASHHLASWCWFIVLPVPKPPGIAAVPPLAIGKSVSITRCPVMSGIDGVSLVFTGLAVLIGHCWHRVSSCLSPRSSSITATVSCILYSPSGFTSFTTPESKG